MRAITGILTGIALVLVGCSPASQPESLPDPSLSATAGASSSTEGSPSAPLPSPTETATRAERAVAALESYFASANAAARGSDLGRHRRTFAPSCAACSSATDDFEAAQGDQLKADGDRYSSWTTEVQDVSNGQVVILTVMDFAGINLVDQQGIVVDRVPPLMDATFAWTVAAQPDGSWLVIQGQRLP
jgi:hypothetical protein